jgi:hypothetical protein
MGTRAGGYLSEEGWHVPNIQAGHLHGPAWTVRRTKLRVTLWRADDKIGQSSSIAASAILHKRFQTLSHSPRAQSPALRQPHR